MQYIRNNDAFCASQAAIWTTNQLAKKSQQNGVIRMLRLQQPEFYATHSDEDIRDSLDQEDSDFV